MSSVDNRVVRFFKKKYNSFMLLCGFYTRWKRINFDVPTGPQAIKRTQAEKETTQDLQKPIQQILSDVQEEAITNRSTYSTVAHVNKRMSSMMARVSLSQERSSIIMLTLTIVILALSIFQVLESINNDTQKNIEDMNQSINEIKATIMHLDSLVERQNYESNLRFESCDTLSNLDEL